MPMPSSTLPELSVARNGALVAWMYAATSARIGRYRWARTQLSEPPGRCFLRNGMRLRATKAMPGPAKNRNVRMPSPMMNRFVAVAPARAPCRPNRPPQPRAMITTEPMIDDQVPRLRLDREHPSLPVPSVRRLVHRPGRCVGARYHRPRDRTGALNGGFRPRSDLPRAHPGGAADQRRCWSAWCCCRAPAVPARSAARWSTSAGRRTSR